MLPFGPLLEFLSTEDSEALFGRAEAALLPSIQDPSYTCFPFYLPLLESKTLKSATPAQLETWFCGAMIYLRQSFEDKGIIIASRESLTAILNELGGRFERAPEPAWRIESRAEPLGPRGIKKQGKPRALTHFCSRAHSGNSLQSRLARVIRINIIRVCAHWGCRGVSAFL